VVVFDQTRIRLHWLSGAVTDDADMRAEQDDTELDADIPPACHGL
jgi:hypothetical protein